MIYLPKSQPAPESLAIEKSKILGTYRTEDVLQRLMVDFKNKCYICEEKAPSSINIEHFKPHKGDLDLKFDWNNLFYCCVHCNNTKLAKPIFDEILNCTLEENIDKQIRYFINPFPKEKPEISALKNDEKTRNTVELLNQAYNGTTALKLIESANIRIKLLHEIKKFNDLLSAFDNNSYTSEEKDFFKSLIIKKLNISSSFTAFKRWIIRENEHYSEIFKDYI